MMEVDEEENYLLECYIFLSFLHNIYVVQVFNTCM